MSGDPAQEEQFGPYTVYERLGVGGMATVHRALEHAPDGTTRTVALKRLLPHLAEDASFIKSFVREAKLASLLDHINIVQIYELGRVGSEYFITMEYIDGRDIRRLLRHARKVTGPPPIYVTIGLMIQLCEALDYAHNKADEDGQPLRLVHRDISPSNLIVTSQGHLKVIDFGIAKAESNQLRTQTGRIKGKLAYMAPEAISGSRDLDARSDIWACGVILHELITARPLFAAKNEYQTLMKVQKGDLLPPSTFNQACPPELDAIVFKALARDPKERFANATEMREELLALKKQYNLMTGYRELAGWIDWAFGLEVPDGFSGDTSGVMGMTSRVQHSKTPRPPRNEDEDEAVEVVWGSGADDSEVGPVLLEEVPDVSAKVRARRDTEDESLVDDIPTPLPSHGTLPSIYGSNPDVKVLPATPSRLPPHTIEPLARGTDKPGAPAKPKTGLHPVVPSPAKPGAAAAVIPPLQRPRTGSLPVTKPVTGVQPIAKPITGVQPIATPTPPVGTPVRAGGQTVQPATRPARPTSPGVQPARQSDRMPAEAPRSSDQMPATGVPRASDRMPASGPIQDRPMFDDRMAAQRKRDSVVPENVTTTPSGRAYRADTQASTGSQNAFADELETNAFGAGYADDGYDNVESSNNPFDNDETLPPESRLPPSRPSLSEEELFGNDAAAVLRSVSAQMDAQLDSMATRNNMQRSAIDDIGERPMPSHSSAAALPNVPVVRFSKSHSIPPVNAELAASVKSVPPGTPSYSPSGRSGMSSGMRSGMTTPPPASSGLADPRSPIPVTRPGVAPAAIPRTPGPSRPPVNAPLMPVPPVQVAHKKKTWLFVLIGVLLAGGTATLVALTLTGGAPDDGMTGSTPSPPPAAQVAPTSPAKLVGTVKFDLQPADAEILIEGKPVHTGSPWTTELTAGIHQIEIKKAGFKSWLTSLELSSGESHSMRVMLEAITSTVVEDAALTITTTPAGLDVEIDGVPLPEKTPIKTTLKAGPHKLVVKQNGTEVWQETVNAENSSEYEFNPSFTDAKKRERAQRAATPRPAPAPTPPPPPPATAPTAPTDTTTPAGSAASTDAPSTEPPRGEPPADTSPNPNPAGARPPITTPL